MIFELIFGCCQVFIALTRSELKIESQRIAVMVDEFFDLIHLSLFSTEYAFQPFSNLTVLVA